LLSIPFSVPLKLYFIFSLDWLVVVLLLFQLWFWFVVLQALFLVGDLFVRVLLLIVLLAWHLLVVLHLFIDVFFNLVFAPLVHGHFLVVVVAVVAVVVHLNHFVFASLARKHKALFAGHFHLVCVLGVHVVLVLLLLLLALLGPFPLGWLHFEAGSICQSTVPKV